MKKFFLIMLLPLFLKSSLVISTEIDPTTTNNPHYKNIENAHISRSSYLLIPKNPVLLNNVYIYKDKELTIPVKSINPLDTIHIKNVSFNQNGIAVFELDNQTYMINDPSLYYDDVVLEESDVLDHFWTKKIDKVYDNPYVRGVQSIPHKSLDYSKVYVDKQAKTHSGTYYHIESVGWIDAECLSLKDTRIEKVQQILNEKYNKSNYGIFVEQLDTGYTAGINQTKPFYIASLAKLPVLYYTQKAIDEGKLNLNTKYQYISKVNAFYGSYDPSGSGSLPKTADDKEYTIDDLLKRVSQQSDNVASNILGYYATNQFGADFQMTLTTISGKNWDMKKRTESPETVSKVLEALYQQNGVVLDYLSKTEFDNDRISKDINVKVSHKIGDAYNDKHDAAIVFAQSPFILTVMTNNAEYKDITAIANSVYEILK